MKELLKKALCGAFNLPPIRAAALARLQDRVTVVMYHGVVPDGSPYDAWTLLPASQFEAQLEFICQHFTPLTIDQATNPPTGLDKPGLVVTFDDGLRNNLKTALPLLEAYGVPATLYVSTQRIEDGGLFWWDQIALALQQSRVTELDLSSLGLALYRFADAPPRQRWGDIENMLSAIKRDAYTDRETIAKRIAEKLLPSPELSPGEFATLTIDELRELAASELITIGSHTHSHDLLTRLALEEARKNIQRAIDSLESWLGTDVRHFAFPGGDHNAELVEVLRSLRVDTAVTIVEGRAGPETDPMQIPRLGMGGYDAPEEWKANLVGLADLKALFSTRAQG